MRITYEHSPDVGTMKKFLVRDDFLPWSSRGGVAISTALVMGPIPSISFGEEGEEDTLHEVGTKTEPSKD